MFLPQPYKPQDFAYHFISSLCVYSITTNISFIFIPPTPAVHNPWKPIICSSSMQFCYLRILYTWNHTVCDTLRLSFFTSFCPWDTSKLLCYQQSVPFYCWVTSKVYFTIHPLRGILVVQVAMNNHHAGFYVDISFLWDKCPRIWLLGSYDKCIFSFPRNCQSIFPGGYTVLCSYQQ